MNADIADTLAIYCKNPRKFAQLYPDIVYHYLPKINYIFNICGKGQYFISNYRVIAKIKMRDIYILHMRYNIPIFYYSIFYQHRIYINPKLRISYNSSGKTTIILTESDFQFTDKFV